MGEQTSPLGTAAIGDNLDYLRLLYEEQMFFDMIYIDPPYNTGNKFSYHDKREDWVDFISKRLKLAKAVLKDDGVIFISIDDSCLYELKVEADGIFSKSNFLGAFITMQAVRSNSRHINTVHEYIIGYAKDKKRLGGFKIRRVNNPDDAAMIKDISDKVRREFILFGRETAKKLLAKLNSDYMLKRGISWLRNYSEVDDEGEIFFPKDLSVPGAPNELIIQEIDLRLPMLKSRKWSTPKKFIKLFNEGRLSFKGNRPYEKHYLNEAADNVSSILNFYSRQGTNDLVKLGLRGLFDTPKPVELIKYLIRISTYEKEGAHILDFFAGSGTTGQAVMEVNIEDKKEHSFYLIQLDEPAAQDSTQYQYAVKNGLPPAISELMLHRLQTAKEKLKYPRDFNVIKAAVYEAIV